MAYKFGMTPDERGAEYQRQRELEKQCTSAEELKNTGREKYAIDFKNKIIKLTFKPGSVIYYSFDEIFSSSVETNGKTTTETSLGSVLGRAAVGSLFGGVGAIIGGLTAGKKQKTVIKSVALKVTFIDNEFPSEIVLFDRGSFSGYGSPSSAEEKATQIHECIARHLASLANDEKGSTVFADGLASQLSAISDLYKQGVLSDIEFRLAKEKLLAK